MSDKKEQVTEIVGIITAIIGLVRVVSGLFGHDVKIHSKKKVVEKNGVKAEEPVNE